MVGRPLWQWSAVDLAASIRSGKVRAADVVASALERLDAANPAVNAVTITLRDEALAAAETADRIVASGVAAGPLHGVPVTIKENIDQAGLPNTNGLPDMANNIAPADSPVAANLKRAGAIVIGCTNTPEFSYRWFTDNPLRGQTLNPWDPAITPGGSSGGASSSVALGIGAIAHGNDLGGSLRYPAYACGVATIKPGLGRVPAYNPSAPQERPPSLQLMGVQGPIAREVRDVRLGLEVMAQGDHRDPWWVPAPLQGPHPTGPINVAVCEGPSALGCAPEVRAALKQAADTLADAGYIVEAVQPPQIEEAADRWLQLLGADTREMMLPSMQELGSTLIGELGGVFASGSHTEDIATYMRLSADRTRIWRNWANFMQDYPLILAPVSQQLPFAQRSDEQGAEAFRDLIEQQSILVAVNVLGLPAAAVPTGLAGTVPVGVQIIGQRFREDMCLDAAQAIEDRVGVLAHQLWSRM
jgi:amidase